MRHWWIAPLLLLISSGCDGCDEPEEPRNPSVAITPLALPSIELERTHGPPTRIASIDGPVLLHFWATWCAPCQRELPGLLALAAELEGIEVVAVTDESWEDVREFFNGDVPEWVARDPDGSLARALGVNDLPDTYLVDPAGVARSRISGPREWTDPSLASWLRTRAEQLGR